MENSHQIPKQGKNNALVSITKELSHFRLLLFSLVFSFLMPLGFLFICAWSPAIPKTFFQLLASHLIIIFPILYVTSVIFFTICALLHRLKIIKKIELPFYLISGAIWGIWLGTLFFQEENLTFDFIHGVIYSLSLSWGVASFYVLFRIIRLKDD